MAWESPHFSEEAPRWTYALSGVGVVLYLHLDAMDGKQARRTGTSSPLGQLFDHGCDCCTSAIRILSSVICLRVPLNHVAVLLTTMNMTTFFAQWEEFHTGLFPTNNGIFGVTEALMLDASVHLATAFFGPQMWELEAFGITLGGAFFWLAIGGHVLTIITNSMKVFTMHGRPLLADDAADKDLGMLASLSHLTPALTLSAASLVFMLGWGSHMYQAYPALVTLAIGLHWCVLTSKLLVAHMCKSPFTVVECFVFQIPLVLATINSNPKYQVLEDEFLVALSIMAYVVICHLLYVTRVIGDVCEYLGIYCFDITTKRVAKKKTT